MFRYGLIFSAALISSVVFTFLAAKISLKYKILTSAGMPLAGGIGIGLAFIFSLGLGIYSFGFFVLRIYAIAAACLFMLLLGVVDDLRELSVTQKFLGQAFCAGLLILSGVRTEIMHLGFWLNAAISFLWILGITNAFNLLDILDGLAAGIALIVSGAFLVMGVLSADLPAQVLSLILCASVSGFLVFNLPPARAYLGNSGSHFLGLLIACVSLVLHYASQRNIFALFSPLMILGLPIIDTLLLIVFRTAGKKSPFSKSRDHLALKIGILGFSTQATILIMYLLCFIFAVCGIVLTKVNNLPALIITGAVFLLSIGIFLKSVKIETNG